ncbi:MAG: hypothetical protein V3U07_09080, partial [Nitrospirales bacterium]
RWVHLWQGKKSFCFLSLKKSNCSMINAWMHPLPAISTKKGQARAGRTLQSHENFAACPSSQIAEILVHED